MVARVAATPYPAAVVGARRAGRVVAAGLLPVLLPPAASGCGRWDFDPATARLVDAAPPWQLVLDDRLDDGDPLVNPSGMGGGFHLEGANADEVGGRMHFGLYDQDYAASLGISLDTFDLGPGGLGSQYRIEWDLAPTDAIAFFTEGPEFRLDVFVVATAAGNDDFDGSVYYNTFGGLYLRTEYSLEGARVDATGALIASDSTKPTQCDWDCSGGYASPALFTQGDLGPLGAARTTITLELDRERYAFTLSPAPTAPPTGPLAGAFADLGLATGADLAAGGFYVGAVGGNNYVGRASAGVDAIRVYRR